jgi:hypothetical protein
VADLSRGLAGALRLKTDQIAVIEILGRREHFLTATAFRALISAPASRPKIYTCAEWGARPSRVTQFAEHEALGIVLHNTQYANRDPLSPDQEREAAFANARDIQIDHMDKRRWADTGQHFTVTKVE